MAKQILKFTWSTIFSPMIRKAVKATPATWDDELFALIDANMIKLIDMLPF